MSIIVVTGQPGSGKTALVVDMLANDDQFKGRPLFVMGIPDLAIDHTPCPPVADWTEYRASPDDDSLQLAYFRFPENALVVLDEAQRIYRPRAVGSKVPPEVAAFETHRHTGVDFVLLTQHPGLIDANIRKLVGRHIHIRVTPLGRYKYEWTELGDPESASSREIAARSKYVLPKRAFDLYKSSQLHTKIKVKMPWFVYMFGVAAVSFIGLGWYGYHRVMDRVEPKTAIPASSPGMPSNAAPPAGSVKTTAQYIEERQPRIAHLAYTAPVYDEITKPVDAPFPAGCLTVKRPSGEVCRCVDQQGNDYPMPDNTCRQVVQHGIFKDWGFRETANREANKSPQSVRPDQASASAGLVQGGMPIQSAGGTLQPPAPGV